MVKRVVDTDFWTDMDVIDFYSPEDKYFYLYLITNGKSSQLGIYPLPIKVISFETGYSTEAVKVLLERFSEKYKQIIYSEDTQEVTVLNSLKFSILKGGKPVKDLLEKELALVKDATLIQATYDNMIQFWEFSKRIFDKTIQTAFENELRNRRLMNEAIDNDPKNMVLNNNESHNVIQNVNDNDIYNDNDNDNDNEESWATNRGLMNIDEILKNNLSEETSNESVTTNRQAPDEKEVLEHYTNIIKKYNPNLEGRVNSTNIVNLYYQEALGETDEYIEKQLLSWQQLVPKSLVLEALSRSVKATSPLSYCNSIIERWMNLGITSRKEVLKRDAEFKRKNF